MKKNFLPIHSVNAFKKLSKEMRFESLRTSLQAAVELEFSTIPPYLTSALSIYPNKNRSSFQIIHSVYMEEMLHMILANNVMQAIGGTIKTWKNNIPEYPIDLRFNEGEEGVREVHVALARFSADTIETFKQIELPENHDHADHRRKALADSIMKGKESIISALMSGGQDVDTKEVQHADDIPAGTIGEFYTDVKEHLKTMCDEYGEENVFIGDPSHQVTQDFYWASGGKPIVVKRLKDACDAIDLIIEQGEGGPDRSVDGKPVFKDRSEVSHYYRFDEIIRGRYYPTEEDPSGEKFVVDFNESYNIKSNCQSSDFEYSPKLQQLNSEFNKHYTLMLDGLEKGLNGQMKSIYPAIMNDMHSLAKIGLEMVQLPIRNAQGEDTRQNGAPTYEWADLHMNK